MSGKASVPVFRVVAIVEPRAQLLARLEEGYVLGLDGNRIPGARVAACTGIPLAHGESTESPQLHAIPPLQSGGYLVEYHIDDPLDLTRLERGVLFRQPGDEF